MKKRIALIFMAFLLLLPPGCALIGEGDLERYERSYLDVFDTVSILIFYAPDETTAAAWAEEAHRLLVEYHRLYDIYNSYEGLNNARTLNENAGVAPVEVPRELIELILFAKEMHAQTGGKLNVALGSVLSIWHDCREAGLAAPDNAQLPSMDALRDAYLHTDIENVIVDEAAGTVYLADPYMSLDLGAVAKGFAAQRVADAMEAMGVASMLLNLGGNICCVGRRADGKDWKVEVESPYGGAALCALSVNGKSLVTSGSYQRYYEVQGARYHHIIDPATLMPAAYFDSVSVLSSDSDLADALSTALFNMPLEEGRALAASFPGTEVLWVAADGTQISTEGFAAHLSDGKDKG